MLLFTIEAIFAPLYIYSDGQEDLLANANEVRQPNYSPKFLAEIKNKIGKTTPEKIFYYLYAVLYSPGYRVRYAEFLKRDFPRVPITADKTLFAIPAQRSVAVHNDASALHLRKQGVFHFETA